MKAHMKPPLFLKLKVEVLKLKVEVYAKGIKRLQAPCNTPAWKPTTTQSADPHTSIAEAAAAAAGSFAADGSESPYVHPTSHHGLTLLHRSPQPEPFFYRFVTGTLHNSSQNSVHFEPKSGLV